MSKLRTLYDTVSQNFDLGDFESFQQAMSQPERRRAFHSAAGQDFDLGDYPKFESVIATALAEPPPEPVDRFRSIADPVDLEQYPEDAPDLANDIPFYRAASVELLFRNMTDLQDTWTDIQEDVQGLIDALNTGLTNPVTEDVVIS